MIQASSNSSFADEAAGNYCRVYAAVAVSVNRRMVSELGGEEANARGMLSGGALRYGGEGTANGCSSCASEPANASGYRTRILGGAEAVSENRCVRDCGAVVCGSEKASRRVSAWLCV